MPILLELSTFLFYGKIGSTLDIGWQSVERQVIPSPCWQGMVRIEIAAFREKKPYDLKWLWLQQRHYCIFFVCCAPVHLSLAPHACALPRL